MDGAATPCWTSDRSGLEYRILNGLLRALSGPLPLGVFPSENGTPQAGTGRYGNLPEGPEGKYPASLNTPLEPHGAQRAFGAILWPFFGISDVP